MTEQRNSRIALLAVVMLLSGAFLGLVVSDNASAARYDLNGFVSDNNANVSITILDRDTGYKKTTSTLEDGYYSFNNVESGSYDIRYSKDGFLAIRNNLSVSADGPLDTVTMVAAPSGVSTLSGTVKDQDDTPVVGATITLYSTTAFEDSWWSYDDIGYSWSVDSDEAGTYQFTDMPGTVFDVRVTSDEHYTHTASSVD
ncbi:MAG: carboxypeptidase-like regulatory domain-containing protein, partial [Candidatus Thermoplasmatota archaeon]|nr:carboxypeptidase-like regulatory domain-containing protein [Candidatus Thermoplasmatota archaeon]